MSDACAPTTLARPADLAAWAALFEVRRLPVLAATAAALETLRANEDKVDAHLIAETISNDPLMTLKVLAHVAALRAGRECSDTETVTAALVMLGITPFFNAFGPQASVDDALDVTALDGFNAVLRRSHRAARFAMGFSAHRMDGDAVLLHQAALLHDFAELLLWLRAPLLAMHLRQLQAKDPTLRSAQAQRKWLGIELPDLEQYLVQQWRLTGLLQQFTDDRCSRVTPQMHTVRLAIRLARHSSDGWSNAALPDDLQEIAALLNLSIDAADRLVREIDID